MNGAIYCLLDDKHEVHARPGAESYEEVAAANGLEERNCLRYRYDLANRRLQSDRGTSTGDFVVHAYLDQRVGTPERLLAFAAGGHLSKPVLMNLITPEKRKAYADACAAIEKRYTDECKAQGEPCLESGCAVEEEICLQPLERAGEEYYKACAEEWVKLFAEPDNRIDAWRK